MFIIAFLGFCWEQCKSARSRRNPNTRNNLYLNKQAPPVHVNTITNSHAHDANCHNHYPSWMFDTMVSEQVRNMRNYVEISEKGKKNAFFCEFSVHSGFIVSCYCNFAYQNLMVIKITTGLYIKYD